MKGIDRDLIEFYKKISDIRNNYTLKKVGKLTLEGNALIKYDDLCVDLIKENQKYKEVFEKIKSLLNDYELQGNEIIKLYCEEIKSCLKEVE